jgi:hypothetical protein
MLQFLCLYGGLALAAASSIWGTLQHPDGTLARWRELKWTAKVSIGFTVLGLLLAVLASVASNVAAEESRFDDLQRRQNDTLDQMSRFRRLTKQSLDNLLELQNVRNEQRTHFEKQALQEAQNTTAVLREVNSGLHKFGGNVRISVSFELAAKDPLMAAFAERVTANLTRNGLVQLKEPLFPDRSSVREEDLAYLFESATLQLAFALPSETTNRDNFRDRLRHSHLRLLVRDCLQSFIRTEGDIERFAQCNVGKAPCVTLSFNTLTNTFIIEGRNLEATLERNDGKLAKLTDFKGAYVIASLGVQTTAQPRVHFTSIQLTTSENEIIAIDDFKPVVKSGNSFQIARIAGTS